MGAVELSARASSEALALSPEAVAVAIFPRSTASSYAMCVALAQQAIAYRHLSSGRSEYHLAAFGNAQAGLAVLLLEQLHGKAGVSVFVNGRALRGPWDAMHLLRCVSQADQCADWKAHCHMVVNDSALFSDMHVPTRIAPHVIVEGRAAYSSRQRDTDAAPVERWIVPCSFLYAKRGMRLSMRHPSSPADQIQAAAVEHGCTVCPRFNARGVKKLVF